MALEAVIFQQDPFIYGCKDYSYNMLGGFEEEKPNPLHHNLDIINEVDMNSNYISRYRWESPPSSAAQSSSPQTDAFSVCRRKRRRPKPAKNKEAMENQRMTHIAVERNRRRQMNDYLAVLRSLMPPSYAQRGDQASIVGGAINFVKELEQVHQFLEANNGDNNPQEPPFSKLFSFPQYSTCGGNALGSSIADIEVTMVESHANIKLSTKKRPKQLLKLVAGFQSIALTILHLNITTVDHSVLYSFSVKVEDECELSTVNDIATNVHDILAMIQE